MGEYITFGSRVIVLEGAEYRGKYKGAAGTAVQLFGEYGVKMVGVRLDAHVNPASKKGLFWFAKSHLSTEELKENFMLENYKRAEVTFLDDNKTERVYHYALYDDAATVGDVVAVNTGSHGLSLARITAISDEHLDLVICGREIISRVDFTAYTARKEREEKIAQLKQGMDRKVQQLQQYAIYELMAEKDPELKTMLDDMKRLLIGDAVTQNQ